MPAILAIDAAWTDHEPSGVSLLDGSDGSWRCVALAPSYQDFLLLAEGQTVDWTRASIAGSIPDAADLLKAAEKLLGGRSADLVPVDMPLATTPITGRRVADTGISKAFGAQGCAAHSPNATRPGSISDTLRQSFDTLGFPLAAANCPVGTSRRLIEVYPHPALLTLLNRTWRVPYKISKTGKYWPGAPVPDRLRNLLQEFHAILAALQQQIAGIPDLLPPIGQVTSFSSLKRYEDALDALVCGWVGMTYLAGQAMAYGDDTAAIWVPNRT
jgi:predicted RNase H-like nuclease